MFLAMTCSQETLQSAIDAYIQRHGMTRTGFGKAALDDRSFFTRFGRGSSLTPRYRGPIAGFHGA